MQLPAHAARHILQSHAPGGSGDIRIETDDEGAGILLRRSRLGFHHSFVSGPVARRARQSNQALLRACNDRKRGITDLLDLTAGWGIDSYLLARQGQRVTLVEYNPLLCALLAHAVQCLGALESGRETAARMRVEQANSADYLAALDADHPFDCIYLDPMFPAHKSGAKPGKEMQVLQALTENRDIEACFDLALQKAHKRVVVKRPAKAAGLSDRRADIVYREKTIRFDVYLTGG